MRLPQSNAELADRDGMIATSGIGLFDRALRVVFGSEPPLALGSEKLAARQQYGMLLRRFGRRAVPAAATAALMAAGYGSEQIAVLHMTFDAFSGRMVAAARDGGR